LAHKFEGFCNNKPSLAQPLELIKSLDLNSHETYFKSPSYLAMVNRKFGKPGTDLIERMNQKTLKRKLFG
jgi:hypothetical protein